MSYAAAALVSNKMQDGAAYATVTSGKYRGTIGKVAMIKCHHYAKHSYNLDVNGKSIKFCGSLLELCDEAAPILLFNEDYTPTYLDFNEREIAVGQRIVVCKRSNAGSGADMLVGNVRRVDDTGVYFAPFAINGSYTNEVAALVKVCKTASVMIIDSTTGNAIMLQKLSAGEVD